jgi:hypothetical protein
VVFGNCHIAFTLGPYAEFVHEIQWVSSLGIGMVANNNARVPAPVTNKGKDHNRVLRPTLNCPSGEYTVRGECEGFEMRGNVHGDSYFWCYFWRISSIIQRTMRRSETGGKMQKKRMIKKSMAASPKPPMPFVFGGVGGVGIILIFEPKFSENTPEVMRRKHERGGYR